MSVIFSRDVSEKPVNRGRFRRLALLLPLLLSIGLFTECAALSSELERITEEEALEAEAVLNEEDDDWLLIRKKQKRLFVVRNRKVIRSYAVATGVNDGQKQKPGDWRTPEGVFKVLQIQNASYWTHDFRDGKGEIKGAYGPWFIRLKTPWRGIGIHGTHDPQSIGKNATEGCIRLRNEELKDLKEKYIKLSMVVVIRK